MLVAVANTVVDEDAVMVHFGYTVLANAAVL